MSNKQDSWFEKTDATVVKCLKALSNVSGVFLIGIMLLAFFNVIGEKFLHHGVPQANELIQYFHVPVVFMAAAYVTLDPGHTTIDLLFKKFPSMLRFVLSIIANVLGCGISAFVAYMGIARVQDALAHHTKASTSGASFPIWPFGVIFVVGFFLVSLAFLWSIVRVIHKGPDKAVEMKEGGAE